jgi:D-alanine-D-alanine ligase
MLIGITFTLKHPDDGDDVLTTHGSSSLNDANEEFDSPETIAALAAALEAHGHDTVILGDGPTLLRRLLDGPRPDLVLNIAEGRGNLRGREARVPAVLEMFGIPYTGSDPLTLAAALDKDCAKRLMRAGGVPTPDWVLIDGCNDKASKADQRKKLDALPLPVFIKPAFEGSSKGIVGSNLIDSRDELHRAVERLQRDYAQPILVEEYIEGDELTVGIVGHEPQDVLGIMHVIPLKDHERFVYGIDVKRDWLDRIRYECPANLSPADEAAVRKAALGAWRALGCRDVTRLDFRLRRGVPYCLELNPLPGLSPTTGDLVILAGMVGVGHTELIGRIVESAQMRMREMGSFAVVNV